MGLPRDVFMIKSDDFNILAIRIFNVPRVSFPWSFVTAVVSKNWNDAVSDRQKEFDDVKSFRGSQTNEQTNGLATTIANSA